MHTIFENKSVNENIKYENEYRNILTDNECEYSMSFYKNFALYQSKELYEITKNETSQYIITILVIIFTKKLQIQG